MLVQEIFPDHELLIVPFACLLWVGEISTFSRQREALLWYTRK